MPVERKSEPTPRTRLALALLAAAVAAQPSCQDETRTRGESDGGTDAGADTDADSDTDSDTDADAGPDAGPDECGGIVLDGSAVIHTVADIAALAGVTHITGDLTISDTFLSNVNGLESLVCVDGNVYIGNTMSWSPTGWLDGLCNLRRIGGTLTIEANNTAGYVSPLPGVGLYALEEVEGGVVLSNNTISSLVGLGNLAHIGGTGLTIDGNLGLADPAGLTSLTTIDGDLLLIGSELHSLDGLSSLVELNGSLKMQGTSLLTDLSGLSGLTELQGLEIIGDSSNMQTSLYGLHNIHTISGNIEFYNLESLEDLQGLSGLTTVVGTPGWDNFFNIIMCNSLKDLSGLESLTSMPDVIFLVDGNASLANLHGVENLEQIMWLGVSGNAVLDNLDGLIGLQHISGPIYYIGFNPHLHSVRGLHHLEEVGSSVTINDNPELPTCRAQAFIDHLHSVGWDDDYVIADNGPDAGCDEEPL